MSLRKFLLRSTFLFLMIAIILFTANHLLRDRSFNRDEFVRSFLEADEVRVCRLSPPELLYRTESRDEILELKKSFKTLVEYPSQDFVVDGYAENRVDIFKNNKLLLQVLIGSKEYITVSGYHGYLQLQNLDELNAWLLRRQLSPVADAETRSWYHSSPVLLREVFTSLSQPLDSDIRNTLASQYPNEVDRIHAVFLWAGDVTWGRVESEEDRSMFFKTCTEYVARTPMEDILSSLKKQNKLALKGAVVLLCSERIRRERGQELRVLPEEIRFSLLRISRESPTQQSDMIVKSVFGL